MVHGVWFCFICTTCVCYKQSKKKDNWPSGLLNDALIPVSFSCNICLLPSPCYCCAGLSASSPYLLGTIDKRQIDDDDDDDIQQLLHLLLISCRGHTYYTAWHDMTHLSIYQIGVDFALKVIQWSPDTVIRMQLWDIAGQEKFSGLTRVSLHAISQQQITTAWHVPSCVAMEIQTLHK